MYLTRSIPRPLLAAALLSGLLLAGCVTPGGNQAASTTECPADWTRYEDPAGDFSICHPGDWASQEDVFGARAAFFPEGAIGAGGFAENVNVVFEAGASDEELEGAVRRSIAMLEQFITGFELRSEQATELDGSPAKAITFSGSQGNFQLVWHQVITIHDDNAVVVTYTVEDTGQSVPTPTVEAMLAAFELF